MWTLTPDLDQYLAAAGEFLLADPVQNTIQLTALDRLQRSGSAAYGDVAPLFGWWQPGTGPQAAVQCALLHTPPYPVLLTRLPAGSARPLAEQLAARGRELVGVNAEQADGEAFAAAWHELTGATAQQHRRSRLFRLVRLVPPQPPPAGRARLASAADAELLGAWLAAFFDEVGEIVADVTGAVGDRLSHGGMLLWEAAGQPVSLAGMTRPVAGVVRIGPVYTPAELRKRGYAGAVTAALSQAALETGAQHVVLFTDLANPTSNALYQRLGYRPVEDRVVLTFS